MAKIMTVDYEAIPGQARQMRQNGMELNNELTTAYESITEMHNNWYGKRYNALVTEFNKIIPQLNELLVLVVGQIPFTLETVANNYSQADRGQNATSAVNEAPKKVAEINLSTDVGMKFLTSEVTATQESVSSNFSKAVELMNTIESIYNSITWQSEAADAFKAQFTKLKNQIVQAFEDLKSQFTTLMNQTKDDIQATETANTVQ